MATAAAPPAANATVEALPSVSDVDALPASVLHPGSSFADPAAQVPPAPLICALSVCASEVAPVCATKSPTPVTTPATATPPSTIAGATLRARAAGAGGGVAGA